MALALDDLLAPSFPLRKGERGYVRTSTGAELIRESVRQILGTQPGERVMLLDFGCDLDRLTWEPNDAVLSDLAKHTVGEALAVWEPRVEVTAVEPTRDEVLGILKVTVKYRIRSTGKIDTATVERPTQGR